MTSSRVTRWQLQCRTLALAWCAALAAAGSVEASTAQPRTITELSTFADVVVTGLVETVTSGWDPAVGSLYTYVTLRVDEVLKGPVESPRVTVKQLGGLAGDIGLFVSDQAAFEQGEEVLLFLETRPRDRTLYTSGLSQGKWQLARGAGGERIAVRGRQQVSLTSVRTVLAGRAAPDTRVLIDGHPVEAASSQPFILMPVPYRYSFLPFVDIQFSGQPGLPGGGFDEIGASLQRWNTAGSSFRYIPGGATAGRCTTQFLGNYRVTISFMDPCGEISNSGGTLAIGGSYFSSTAGTTVGGRFYRLALEGFVINNDSAGALEFLSKSGCFQDVELHELGHVLGLGHSTDATSIMFPAVHEACAAGPRELTPDDLQGLLSIYPPMANPPGAPGPLGQPTVRQVTTSGDLLNVAWNAGAGAAATNHRLDFFFGDIQVVSFAVGAATTVDIPIPVGAQGTFSVRVTPFVEGMPGPPSPPLTFAIGVCAGPPLAPAVSGGIVEGIAAVSWLAIPEAAEYFIQAGTTQGAADVLSPTSLGAAAGASAPVPPGFAAWVRVVAVNACGQSPPADFFLQ